MSNLKVFVDFVFRRDKKSDVAKTVTKEASKAGVKAGQQFGSNFNKNAKAQLGGLNKTFSGLRSNVLRITAAFVGFQAITSAISALVGGFRDFSRSVAEVNSILPKNQKLTKDSIDTFQEFAGSFGTDSARQAKAFYSIVSAGVKGTSKQLETLRVANQAAVAGLVDIDTASKALVSSVNAYKGAGLTAQEASDSLFTAVREGQTTFGELADFLGNTSSIAASAGVSFNELTGTVAALTKGGIDTSKATVALRSILTTLIKPSEQATKAASRYGLELSGLIKRSGGFVNALGEVAKATKGSTERLGQIFGNVRGLSGALKLINGDFADFKRIVDETNNSTGATQDAFEEIAKSADFKLTQLTSEIKAFANSLIVVATPAIDNFIENLKSLKRFILPEKSKTVLELASEQIDILDEQIRKLTPQYEKLKKQQEDGSALAEANKQIFKDLKVRLGELKKNKAKNFDIIRSFSQKTAKEEIDIEKQKQAELQKIRLAAIDAVENLNLKTTADIRKKVNTDLGIIKKGLAAEQEQLRIDLENKEITRAQFKENEAAALEAFNERKAQILNAGLQQETAIELQQRADRNALLLQQQEQFNNQKVAQEQLRVDNSIGLAATEALGITKALKDVGITSVKVGNILKNGVTRGIGNAFQAMGKAIASGSDAFSAFAEAAKSAVADVASTFGDLFIKQALGFSATGAVSVSVPLLAAGVGLKLFSGFLGGGGGSSSGGGGGGGGGASSIDSPAALAADIEEPEVQEAGPRVALTIEGNVFDTDDTRKSIVDFLNEEFSENGANLENAAFA